jgi:carboxymethylenebutenolidase
MLPVIGVAALVACGEEPPAPGAAAPASAQASAGPAPTAALSPRATVLERDVAYGEAKSRNLVGFLAMPADAAEPLPALIVIHEWWGLDDDMKTLARRLAGEGYVALAVDLYGGATASTPDRAQQLMRTVVEDPDAARDNLRQAYDYLEKYAFAPRIGTIGWDLGAGWSLRTAMDMPAELDAMVMYYGQFVTDEKQLSTLRMPILALFGALDESLPSRDVMAFRQKLNELGKQAQVVIYPKAGHAFANPSGANYNAAVADESWKEVVRFLEANLKAPAAQPN